MANVYSAMLGVAEVQSFSPDELLTFVFSDVGVRTVLRNINVSGIAGSTSSLLEIVIFSEVDLELTTLIRLDESIPEGTAQWQGHQVLQPGWTIRIRVTGDVYVASAVASGYQLTLP
jgi:hypothetical protein